MAYIYKITNDINQKIYIGKTEFSIEKRFKEHCLDAFKNRNEKRPLYAAMRKYGIEHFHIEQIEKTENPEEREIYWINFYNSYENGYNATLGGDGKKYIDYDLVCKVYQENQYNQKLTAQLLNISPDSVHNILITKKVPIIKNLKKSKSVIQYNKNREKIQEFYSCGEAARFLINQNITTAKIGTVTNKITECANHKRKSTYNFLWEFG